MRRKNRTYFAILFVGWLFLAGGVNAQFTDSSKKVLSLDEFLNLVKEHHPLSIQAELQLLKGEAALTKARGGLDPKLMSDLRQKYYSSKDYYSLLDAGLKVPTWIGLDIKAGYEQNEGVFLNPENNVPSNGLVYAGLSMPIGRGLFIDQRRAELKKAKIFVEATQADRRNLLNELMLESAKAYWNWFEAYHDVEVFKEAIEAAEFRFEFVRSGAEQGDRPSIDTLEAGIQVQARQVSYQESKLNLLNSIAILSVFLWADGQLPLEIDTNIIPMSMEDATQIALENDLNPAWDTLIVNHPELLSSQFKIDQYEVDRRLKKENLKPVLNLKYNAINEPINGDVIANYSVANYNWGFQFAMPLFLRKERGDLRLANVKIQEAEFALTTKRQMLLNKARVYVNQTNITRDQIELFSRTVTDYSGLLRGERVMFDGGESSLFMVNSREVSYINARIKLINLVTKNRKAKVSFLHSLGVLSDELNGQ